MMPQIQAKPTPATWISAGVPIAPPSGEGFGGSDAPGVEIGGSDAPGVEIGGSD